MRFKDFWNKILKRALIILVALMFLFLAIYPTFVNVNAEESDVSQVTYQSLETDGGTLLYTVENDEITISSFSGELNDVTIPSKVGDLPVVAIDNYCFSNSSMTSLVLPDSITKIGAGAFYFCEKLESVKLGNKIESLGDYLFYYCSSLKSFSVPESVEVLPAYMFYACFNLTNIELPDTMKAIGDYGVYACESLKTIKLPSQLVAIGNYSFYDCHSLTAISFPETLTSIGDYAFYFCKALKTFTLTKNIQNFGAGVLLKCTQLNSVKVDSENKFFKTVDGVLYSADKSKLIYYPEGNTASSFTVPSGVTVLDVESFSENKTLKTVKLPSTLLEISDYAFANCTSLNKITIPNSVKTIHPDAFYGCKELSSLDIPPSVTIIGDEAFAECTGLSSIKLPSQLDQFGSYVFFGCTALKKITVPKGLTSVGEGLFIGCDALEEISVEKGSTLFSSVDGILYSADGTELVCYPCAKPGAAFSVDSKVKKVQSYAFAMCKNLTSIELHDGLESIGARAFQGTLIKEILIPSTVNEVEGGIFAFCKKLEKVEVSKKNEKFVFADDGLYSSDMKVLYSYLCTSKTENLVLDLYNSKVADSAFAGNTTLKSVTFLNASASIGSDVFADCSEDLIIYGFEQSTAKVYATNNGLKFGVTDQDVNELAARTTKDNDSSVTTPIKQPTKKINPKALYIWTTVGLLFFVVVCVSFIIIGKKKR